MKIVVESTVVDKVVSGTVFRLAYCYKCNRNYHRIVVLADQYQPTY